MFYQVGEDLKAEIGIQTKYMTRSTDESCSQEVLTPLAYNIGHLQSADNSSNTVSVNLPHQPSEINSQLYQQRSDNNTPPTSSVRNKDLPLVQMNSIYDGDATNLTEKSWKREQNEENRAKYYAYSVLRQRLYTG